MERHNSQIKPMHLRESLIWFGAWALILLTFIYGGYNIVAQIGLTEFEGFVLVMTLPLSFMLVTAVVVYYYENKKSMIGFLNRFRINTINIKDVYWGIALFVFMMISYGLFSFIGKSVIEFLGIAIPTELFSLIDPRFSLNSESITDLIGSTIRGNFEVLILYFIMLLFNIIGEELLWRGYVLPRQEIAFGKYAWMVHGTMWTFFHAFKWWDLIGLLPVCLSLSYVAQRTKSTWPGIIAHFLFNGMGLMFFIIAAMS